MAGIKRANCPHGVEYGRGGFATNRDAITWNGPVSRCDCCLSEFGWLGSGKHLSTVIPADGETIVDLKLELNAMVAHYAQTRLCGACVQS